MTDWNDKPFFLDDTSRGWFQDDYMHVSPHVTMPSQESGAMGNGRQRVQSKLIRSQRLGEQNAALEAQILKNARKKGIRLPLGFGLVIIVLTIGICAFSLLSTYGEIIRLRAQNEISREEVREAQLAQATRSASSDLQTEIANQASDLGLKLFDAGEAISITAVSTRPQEAH